MEISVVDTLMEVQVGVIPDQALGIFPCLLASMHRGEWPRTLVGLEVVYSVRVLLFGFRCTSLRNHDARVVGSRLEAARIRRSDREGSYRLEGLVRWIRIFTYRLMECVLHKIFH